MPSKRGGGSAPRECRTKLRRCMMGDVRTGGSLRSIASNCMSAFNTCRTKGRRRKTGTRKRRRSRRR